MIKQNVKIGQPKVVDDFKEVIYGGYFEETRLLNCKATYGRAYLSIYAHMIL